MMVIKDQKELAQRIADSLGKPDVVTLTQILYNQRFDINELMSITFLPEKEVAFRAAWLLENLILMNPDHFINNLDQLIGNLVIIKNKSCQRHYIKIMMHLTEPKTSIAVKQKLAKIDLEPAVAYCFDLIIDPRTPVAVKAFSCQFLFNIRDRYWWIAELLCEQLKLLMPGNTPALQAKCRVLLSKLKC